MARQRAARGVAGSQHRVDEDRRFHHHHGPGFQHARRTAPGAGDAWCEATDRSRARRWPIFRRSILCCSRMRTWTTSTCPPCAAWRAHDHGGDGQPDRRLAQGRPVCRSTRNRLGSGTACRSGDHPGARSESLGRQAPHRYVSRIQRLPHPDRPLPDPVRRRYRRHDEANEGCWLEARRYGDHAHRRVQSRGCDSTALPSRLGASARKPEPNCSSPFIIPLFS